VNREAASFLEYDAACEARPEEVGGKARRLALAHRAGIEVPDGVVLPIPVTAALPGQEAGGPLFGALADRFSDAELLVVRSSAPGEDDTERSWAGQFNSMACRNDPAAIFDTCRRCLSSLDSAAAAAYAGAAGEGAQTGMALLVQRLVPADAAGVCFTPGGGPAIEYLVNAVHGLGSALTDDETVADHCRVDLSTGRVTRGDEGRQRDWRPPASPWSLTALPPGLAGRPALDDHGARQVAELARRAAHLLGCRADVEWALAHGRPWLLQARPVTPGTEPTPFTSWTRDNAADVIPGKVTPLTWSLLGPAVNLGFRQALRKLRPGHPPEALFALIDHRAWFNMSAYTRLSGGDLSPGGVLALGLGYLRLLLRHRVETVRAERLFPARLAAARTAPPAEALGSVRRLLDHTMTMHVRTTVLMDFGLTLLRALLGKRTGREEAEELTRQLMAGAGPLASRAATDALERLAETIRRDEAVRQRIAESEPAEALRLLGAAGPDVSGPWSAFLHDHGHGALEEFELRHPRWREAPEFPVRMLQARLERTAGDHRGDEPGTGEGVAVALERLAERLPGPAVPPAGMLVRHLRRCAVLRESSKQLLVRLVDAARGTFLAIADGAGLSPADLVFFLTVDEAARIGRPQAREALAATARERLDRWRHAGEQPNWAEIREYPDGRRVRIPRPAGSGPVLQGLAQSSGRHRGTARLVLDPAAGQRFDRGDVLVARSVNPAWTPLITLAGAVVTDMGNYLSHGAIIARELAIPAVGNLYEATTRITDGQAVEVDGDQGLVRLLRDEP